MRTIKVYMYRVPEHVEVGAKTSRELGDLVRAKTRY